jgi:hypothetical protein
MALSRFAVLALLSFSLATPVAATAESPALLWKARGLQGQERYKKLQQAPPGETGKERRRREIERMLELSFSAQVEAPDLAHETDPDGSETFSLVLFKEPGTPKTADTSNLFILQYVYDSHGKLSLTVVSQLPRPWRVGYGQGERGTVFLLLKMEAGVAVAFDPLDPFSPKVIVY